MWFVDIIRNSINGFLNKKDNSFGFNTFFGSGYKSVDNAWLLAFLWNSTYGYRVTINVGLKNLVVSRTIRMLSESINYLEMADIDGKPIETPIAKKLVEEAKQKFGNDDLITYKYKTILNKICCGMKIVAPIKTDENWYSERLQVLDNRLITIRVNENWDEKILYKNKELKDYVKTLYIPNLQREGYGDCEFASWIDDAILDQSTRGAAVAFYKNDATPWVFFKLKEKLSGEQVKEFENKIKIKYKGLQNKGLPHATNAVEDITVIDNTKAIISGLDSRLYNSNMIGLSLGIDLRALGFMRGAGSQAELKEVLKMANSKIARTAEELSSSLQREFETLVAKIPDWMFFRFVPTYFKDEQQVIDNYLVAHKQGAVGNEEILDLLHNQ